MRRCIKVLYKNSLKQLGKAMYEAVQRYFQDPEHVKKYEAWKKEKEAESDGGNKT